MSGPAASDSKATTLTVDVLEDSDSKLLHQMYQLEKVPTATTLTDEEKSAVIQFEQSVQQTEDGRYSCKLLRVENPPPLGASEKMAKSRFHANERKMKKCGKLKEFEAEMFGHVQLKHVEVVHHSEAKYFLPVKGVVKEESTTTKVRPVFDASARTSTGFSLNDTLLTGPNLYPLILDIILQFRSHRIAYSADISKMYREIKLHKDDKDYHHLFVRAPDGKLLQCRMARLTFGVRPSPFLATSIVRHHGKNHKKEFPAAAAAIEKHFYVDDFLSGGETIQEAKTMQQSLCKLLSLCGMVLRKWRSNNKQFLSRILPALVEQADKAELVKSDAIKTLGIRWDTNSDALLVTTPSTPIEGTVTKRVVARVVASVFDVLGLISPYLICGKILLQSLWLTKFGWDDQVPENMLLAWTKWIGEMDVIRDLQIPRFTGPSCKIKLKTLHGFSD